MFSYVKYFFHFYVLRLQKIVKDINRQLQSQGSGPWPPNRVASLERSLGELSRMLDSKVRNDSKPALRSFYLVNTRSIERDMVYGEIYANFHFFNHWNVNFFAACVQPLPPHLFFNCLRHEGVRNCSSLVQAAVDDHGF